MQIGSEHREMEALRDEFAELIRREPECDMDDVFDGPARQRCGRMISRLAIDRQKALRASRHH